MNDSKFYDCIREGLIADVKYPIKGVQVLLPYGMHLLNNLEAKIVGVFENLGASETGLPELVPSYFLNHLRKEGLFEFSKPHSGILLAPGMEVQAAFVASRLVHSYRDLPLAFYSKGLARREESKYPLVQDLEFRLYELSGFYETEDEACEIRKKSDDLFKRLFDTLGIPTIKVREGDPGNSQIKLYTYFPFSNKFGPIYCSSVIGGKYLSLFKKSFVDKRNKKRIPVQLNLGLTGRILSAYLANHIDESGFNIPREVRPYDVFLAGCDPQTHPEISKILEDKRTYHTKLRSSTLTRKRFLSMGLPIYLSPEKHQYKLFLRRENRSFWIDKTDISRNIKNLLEEEEKVSSPSILIQNVVGLEEPKDGIVYTGLPGQTVHPNLKKIGLDDENNVIFVTRRYD